MAKRTNLALSLALVLVTGLSCDNLTAPATTGGIDIVLLSPTGTSLVVSPRGSTSESAVDLSIIGGNTANVLLDGVRVTVTGPTSKSVTVNTATGGFFQVTVDGLVPGSYTVVVEGIVGGKVGHYGETSNIVVTAGNSTPAAVSFPVFQPVVPNLSVIDTVEVLRFTVSYSAVPSATSYAVAWSTSPTMAGAQSKSVTTTSTEVNVPAEGRYYFTVRAVNATVTADGLPSVPKPVQVFQSVATVTVSPSAPAVTAGTTQQFTFEARDADNVIVANPPVVWVSNNHNVATVNPTTGLATTITSGTAVISAVAKGTPGTATLTSNPMPPTKLVITTQPSNTTAGQPIASVQVSIQNPQNQVATTDNATAITIAFGTNAGGGTLGGTKTVTVANGVATFTTLSVDKTGTGYTLTATAPSTSLTSATSNGFNITPGGSQSLAFIIQPSTVTAGSPISPAVQVEVRDGSGNRATGAGDPITIAIGTNPSGGALDGTKTVNAINGVASFSGLSIDKNGTGYTLTATSGSLTLATSAAFNIGAATQLAFVTQPSNAVAGSAVSPAVQVEVRDAAGNRVTSARDAVTIAISANPASGTLSGTATVNAVNGIATFTGLSLDKAAPGYTLVASAASLASTPASTAFTISAGPVSRVAFTTQPSTVTTDDFMTVGVIALDAFGNQTTAAVDVTVALSNNPGGATLFGTPTVQTSGGVASFTDLQINKVGSPYTLVITSGTLGSATSAPINVNAGAPYRVAFVNQPGDAEPGGLLDEVQVVVQDFYSNNTSADGIEVVVVIWDNPTGATISGTQFQFTSGGVATFPDLSIDLVGNGYTLATGAGGLQAAFGDAPFDVALEFTDYAMGMFNSCGLTNRGSIYCSGLNGSGQLGTGNNDQKFIPTRVLSTETFTSLSVGREHSCAIRASDALAMCWGNGANGRLGNNGVANSNVPVLVDGGIAFTQISAGSFHTCGIRASDNRVLCWGFAGNGRLGNNSFGGDLQVPGLTTDAGAYTQISAGADHTCGIRSSDGRVLCWGFAGEGRLGNATTTPDLANPNLTTNTSAFSKISVGSHTCAVRVIGDAGLCWGPGTSGQIGNNGVLDATVPALVSGSLRFGNITAGSFESCGATVSGEAFCWGSPANGRLGNGVTTGALVQVPSAVVGGRTFTSIHSGQNAATCGATTTGAFCWGFGVSGQLGNGSTTQTSTPIRVSGSR